MSGEELSGNTRAGTLGGTLLIIFSNPVTEVVHTAVVAGVGAAVSYMVSLAMKRLMLLLYGIRKRRQDRKKNRTP